MKTMANLRLTVNTDSRFETQVRHRFARAVSLALIASAIGAAAAAPSVADAQAQRVVLLPATGSVPLEDRDTIEDRLASAVRGLGFEVLSEGGALQVQEQALPETANDMRAVAELQGARWALLPIVHDADAQAYWLTLRVGYAPDTRVEELDAEVRRANEDARLSALLAAILRPEGLGEEGSLLAGQDTEGRALEGDQAAVAARADDEERAREEAAEQERQAAAEAEAARETEQAEQAAVDAYANRDRYGVADGSSLVSVGLGARSLVKVGDGGSGGALGTLELRYGRGLAALPGLELRAGLDLLFGAVGGFDVHVGAAYFVSVFSFPLHLGAVVEGGLFMPVTGQRRPGGMVRASLLAAYNVGGGWYAELSAPGFTWISNGGGAMALGASAHLGLRF